MIENTNGFTSVLSSSDDKFPLGEFSSFFEGVVGELRHLGSLVQSRAENLVIKWVRT